MAAEAPQPTLYSSPRRRDPEAPIDTLTPKQRAALKKLAHSLKPIVHIGASGITDAATDAVQEAFGARELLKVKVHRTAPRSAREAGEELVRQVDGAHLVQVIGRTVVLYRPDPQSPTIVLPP